MPATMLKMPGALSEAVFRGVMDLAAAVHVVEAGVIAFMCRARGCTPVHTLGWMLITLLIGYGGMHGLKVQTRRRDQATAKLRANKAS
ncbi:domain of unknown function (DUF4499) [Haematococcus lacustris]|uniref:Uncharacterized protein n=1 Tax=Haematococcus lacustris TaxID=44745 RepID=A0A6A0AAT5_HAELA|nr:domain of unknown function (DUF4499) [Haematococcus lacustris]